jgi:dissimilatory sulfite reductase (desulfoviridin) alpha/beta subunit
MTVKKPDEIIRQIENILQSWLNYAVQCHVEKHMQKAIEKTFLVL